MWVGRSLGSPRAPAIHRRSRLRCRLVVRLRSHCRGRVPRRCQRCIRGWVSPRLGGTAAMTPEEPSLADLEAEVARREAEAARCIALLQKLEREHAVAELKS